LKISRRNENIEKLSLIQRKFWIISWK